MSANDIPASLVTIASRINRLRRSICETRHLLAKEEAVSADLRHHEYVARYRQTLASQELTLAEYRAAFLRAIPA